MLGPVAHPLATPRDNGDHASVTDPDARLYKKAPGAAAMLCFMGHTLMENRNGLVVQADLTHADGHGERKAALEMIDRHPPGSTRRLTLAADKGYDSRDFVAALRRMVVTPHVAQKSRSSAIDGRTTQHPGYALSQRHRKKIEEPFGWAKTVGGMAQTAPPRPRQGPRPVHDDHGRLQPRPTTEAPGSLTGRGDNAPRLPPAGCRLRTPAAGKVSSQPEFFSSLLTM